MAKKCYFTKYGTEPDYKDVETLQKFLSNRMKILPREKTGLTAKNQRKLCKHIKYARYLALLPYNAYQGKV